MENNTIPLIIVSETGKVDSGVNFGEKKDNDKEYLAEQLKEIQLDGRQPLIVKSEVGKQYIYYKESSLIRILRYYPIVMFILVISFIAIGFLGFRSEKNAEQNRIWAGLAKETAHQLGTPISGMIAWLEHLKLIKGDDEETMEIVTELERDIDRLGYITDRFSKIGSDPELSAHNLTVLTHNIFEYMERRSPRRVKFEYPSLEEPERMVMINAPLMEWVLENLLRNALDTIGKEGLISGEFIEDLDYYYIDVSDTGKGIPDSKFNTIFKPGFTTKKRGWGLGLSLAKRIVESYHNGKIFVKESVVNKGTTFRIQLPKQ
jgi:signal transduction histidine kinase